MVIWYKLKLLNGSVLFLQNEKQLLDYMKKRNIKYVKKGGWYYEKV